MRCQNLMWVSQKFIWRPTGGSLRKRLLCREAKKGHNKHGGKKQFNQSELEKIEIDAAREVEQRNKRNEDVQSATNVALRFLSFQMRSAKVLRSKLIDKEIPPDLADEAITRLQEMGLQSDREFADGFARGKWRQSRWSPSKIKSELKYRHGLSDEDIDYGLRVPFQEDNSSGSEFDDSDDLKPFDSSCLGEGALMDLVATCKCRIEMDPKLPAETHRRRLIGWLQRRGYDWDTVKKVLEQLRLGF
ncbi:hypothetical protein BSKO_06652 [Bryopsis sp. KO-2023]|nr:hypothetical protein BSKO_06652 [Bryopsis sp. KO-2023]